MERLLVKQGTRDRLKRLHAGESIEVLVAEYEGVDLEAVAAAVVAVEIAEEIAEIITEEE